jgi:hypothetical protein
MNQALTDQMVRDLCMEAADWLCRNGATKRETEALIFDSRRVLIEAVFLENEPRWLWLTVPFAELPAAVQTSRDARYPLIVQIDVNTGVAQIAPYC